MKNFKLILIVTCCFFCSFIIIINGCKKKDNTTTTTTPTPTSPTPIFTATIDGNSFSATSISYGGSNNNYSIESKYGTTNNPAIILNFSPQYYIPLPLPLGTYSLKQDSLGFGNRGIYYVDNTHTFSTYMSPDTGTVVITKSDTINHRVSGTFNFICTDGTNIHTITNGLFTNINY
jgi:hypothetical protein